MSKDKNSQQPIEDDSNDNSHNIPEQDIKKEKEDLNRRRALKTILGASSLMVINPFSMSAKQTGILVTQTASSSLTPTPSVSVSQSPSSSLTPTPSVSVSQSPSSSLTPTPSVSVSQSPSSSLTPTPTPSTSQTILPVELSEFGVREENGVIKLFWRTESETNNKGFEVQRSTNTFTYNKIGWVPGKGNSNQAVNYEFEEINVESNQWYYYRLKQIDYDGASDFSKTIAIMINEENKTTLKDIAPNIVTDNFVNIVISAGSRNKAEIFIHHFNGQLVASKKVTIDKGNNTFHMGLPNAESGMYVVNVKFAKGKSQTKRFIVK